MTIDRNDPRWTEYVLDEMDLEERTAFEHEIESDPNAWRILEEVRESVVLLEGAFASESPVGLSQEQRQRIEETLAPAEHPRRMRWGFAAAGLAAVLVMGLVTVMIPSLLRSGSAGVTQPIAQVAILPAPAPDTVPTSGQRAQAQMRTVDAEQGADASVPVALATDLASTGLVGGVRTPESEDMAKIETDSVVAVLSEQLSARPADVSQTFPPQPPAPPAPPMRLSLSATRTFEEAANADGMLRNNLFAVRTPATFPEEIRAEASGRLSVVFPDRRSRDAFDTEEYNRIVDNPFVSASEDPLATLSIDVDTAAYANVRRFLNQRVLPPRDAVRIEELINYFDYDYAPPSSEHPLAVHAEIDSAPWRAEHRLVRVGLKGLDVALEERPPTNLVFLIDVSGSMQDANKLPLLKDGMEMLVRGLGENDRVAIVVYAGASGVVLSSTRGDRRGRIIRALDQLRAGGSTNGGAGIQLAYDIAIANFIEGGVNRVILATDGDFNVGVTNNGDLTRLIEEKAETGVFLSVLGFGTGNYNDAGLEALADQGNGNYAYIDTIREARKVLVDEMAGTLITIAKDVKIQIEFNPLEVNAYRLIGYENRVLEDRDFNDDEKDAGEIGSGHTVTALFEVVPTGVDLDVPGVDPLKYQVPARASAAATSGELMTIKIRYKDPDGDESKLIETAVLNRVDVRDELASADFRFAVAVAAFGMILRDSPYKGDATFDSVIRMAEASRGSDPQGYRAEFIELVRRARAISELD